MTAVLTDRVFHRINQTRDGQEIETRARCQDDGHPVGCVNSDWFGRGQPGSFCHCGRIVYHGALPVDRWPRPKPVPRVRPVGR